VEAVPLWAMFGLCSSFLIISFVCQAKLDSHAAARNYHAQVPGAAAALVHHDEEKDALVDHASK
jgi:hypothetical protein